MPKSQQRVLAVRRATEMRALGMGELVVIRAVFDHTIPFEGGEDSPEPGRMDFDQTSDLLE